MAAQAPLQEEGHLLPAACMLMEASARWMNCVQRFFAVNSASAVLIISMRLAS